MLMDSSLGLVSVFGGVILGRNNETAAFSRSAVNRLANVDHLLLVLHGPVDLVVVTGAQIDHDELVPEEEHGGARVVQLVHLVKVRHIGDIDQIDDAVVFDLLGDAEQSFVHFHTRGVPIVAESDEDNFVLFGEDGLVDLPAIGEMSQHKRHLEVLLNTWFFFKLFRTRGFFFNSSF